MPILQRVALAALLLALTTSAAAAQEPAAAPRPRLPGRPVSSLGDSATFTGAVTRPDGSPAAHAVVWVGFGAEPGTRDRDPRGWCGLPALFFVRAAADSAGRFRRTVDVPPSARPDGCVSVIAFGADGPLETGGWSARASEIPRRDGSHRADVRLKAWEGTPSPGDPPPLPQYIDRNAAWWRVPGWAGHYVRDCAVVVQLNDPERQGEAARAFVREHTAGRAPPGCPAGEIPVRFEQMGVTEYQLSRWYGLGTSLLWLDGWMGSGVTGVLVFRYDSEE